MMPLTCSRFSSISFSRASFVTLGVKQQFLVGKDEEKKNNNTLNIKDPNLRKKSIDL